MRWLLIAVLAACRMARPVEVPRMPAGSGSGVGDMVSFSGDVVAPGYLDRLGPPDDAWGVFGPAAFPTQTIVGRYYLDGIYVESRGPARPIWP